MKKGDIVLVRFPFTDFEGSKLRPAVVLIPENRYGDVCVAFITSRMVSAETKDVFTIRESDRGFKDTGLKISSSVLVGKIVTLETRLIAGKLGKLSRRDIQRLNKVLEYILEL